MIPDARQIATGDLNHDGIPDIAVHTIAGQHGRNLHVQYLAVFIRAKGRLVPVARAEVGRKGARSLELKSIEDNTIHFRYARSRTEGPLVLSARESGDQLRSHRQVFKEQATTAQ